MMLYGFELLCIQGGRMCRGCVLRMRIMNHEQVPPGNLIHRNQIANRCLEGPECFVMVKVAYVLANKCLAIDDQGYAALQICSQRKQRLGNRKFRNCTWRIPTGSAEQSRSRRVASGNGIIDSPGNRPLSNQKCVSDT